MRTAWHRALRSGASGRVALALVVVLLSVVGFVVTTHAVDADRRDSADQQAANVAQQLRGLLDVRLGQLSVGLGNAMAGERVPDGRRFAALVGGATTTVGLGQAMWVESVAAPERRAYERRIGKPITQLPGQRRAPPAATYLPATFVTNLPFPTGADMSGLTALAATLRNPASVFAGTVTSEQTVAGERGFFLVQGAVFGHGPGSRAFLVIFVPGGWLTESLNDPARTAISLDGRPIAGTLGGKSAASQSLVALTQQWDVDVASAPATQLQAILPRLALAWPLATALIVYLIGRGMLRRRRAEREVDDIFDLSLDLLCIVGVDGYLKRVNPAFQRTLAHDADELLTHPLVDFVHPDDREATARSLVRLQEGHGAESFESRFVRRDGVVRWLQWNMRPMLERGLMYAAAHDVTEARTLLQELAASRRRIVVTAETRRRIERDLHDGAQQHLVSTIVTLKEAQQVLDDGSDDAAPLVERALESTESAHAELRELARGIHPAVLAKGGLAAALRNVARRSPIPVELDVRTDGRLPEPTEVTAYFVVSEALTNAAKYSSASAVQVTVDRIDGEVRMSISDDGVGGADPARGSGLIGLRDRVEAAGGTFMVESAPGQGTRMTVGLPT